MTAVEILFWFSIVGLFYVYLGYPVLIGLLARLFPEPVQSGTVIPETASVIISCRGEAHALPKKIRNVLACDDANRLKEILIGMDGDTDTGPDPLPEDKRIQVFRFPVRRGKPAVLNDLIPKATGEILFMMDVRQRLDESALTALRGNFADPAVGVVSGELVFESEKRDTADAASIDAYWKLEKWLRIREAAFSSVPGATGALYAIRRELAQPIPTDAALDDVLIPMQAIAKGFRCIFEPAAKIYDRPASDAAREAVRKRRTLAGCAQLLILHPAWLFPFGHPIWWQFGSHKIARLFSPILLIMAAISNLLLLKQPVYEVLAALQAGGYIIAATGLSSASPSLIRKLGVFLRMQGTLLMAWKDALSGKNLALWEKA